MNIRENVPLAPFTTLGVGGKARFFAEVHTDDEREEAIAFAHAHGLRIYLLGAGSNLLIPDEGIDGVVMKMTARDSVFQEDGDNMLLIADAGTPWEEIVDVASAHELFGIENLAGIPGTMGGAAAQNIGAYGAELAQVFLYADVIDSDTGAHTRIEKRDASFGYRMSFFKTHRSLIVIRAALRLSKRGTPRLSYPDLARASASDVPLATPSDIASAVRAIRADKFPSAPGEGTAGSFFKNPCIQKERAKALRQRFPGLPLFPQADGTTKVSLAWLLDHALSLKGYVKGLVRLYEKQPMILVARSGATAADIDAFAREIMERVHAQTGITIEREVEIFGG